MTNNSKQPLMACKPEDYFKIPNGTPSEINVDVLATIINRAYSVVSLLEDNGNDLSRGFELNHEGVMNALECVSGLLEQADTIIEHSYGFYS